MQTYWDLNIEHVMNGLSDCGRLQRYMKEHFAAVISKQVDSKELDAFFDAKNLTEQRKLFSALPLQNIKKIMRYMVHKGVTHSLLPMYQFSSLDYVNVITQHCCCKSLGIHGTVWYICAMSLWFS